MSTSEDVQYHEYIGGCSVHRTSGDIMIRVGDTMSTLGDVQTN